MFAHGIDRVLQKGGRRHAGNLDRILHAKENAFAGTLFRRHGQQVFASETDFSGSNLISGFAGQNIRKRRFSGTVRPHNGMHLALVDGKVEVLDNFPVADAGAKVFNFQ